MVAVFNRLRPEGCHEHGVEDAHVSVGPLKVQGLHHKRASIGGQAKTRPWERGTHHALGSESTGSVISVAALLRRPVSPGDPFGSIQPLGGPGDQCPRPMGMPKGHFHPIRRSNRLVVACIASSAHRSNRVLIPGVCAVRRILSASSWRPVTSVRRSPTTSSCSTGQ